jgi:hypothetical protein
MHAWFRKRALLPPRLPSIIQPSKRPKTKVCPVPGLLTGGGTPPTCHFSLLLDKPFARGDGHREISQAFEPHAILTL